MTFIYLFVLKIFLTTKNVENLKHNINVYDDIFLGDSINLKKFDDKKLNEQNSKGNTRKAVPNIRNFHDYNTDYKSLLLKPTEFLIKERGKCLNLFDFNDLFFNNNKDIKDNLNSISNYLNDLNFLYKDENGNFLIYSVCKDLFFYTNGISAENNENYIKCFLITLLVFLVKKFQFWLIFQLILH